MNFNRFEHKLALDAMSLASVVTPLLHHYRTGLSESVFASRMWLDLTIDCPGNADRIWSSVPARGQAHFIPVARQVSVQMQQMMRAWTHLLWCSNVENLRDTTRTTQVLAYVGSRPFYPKIRDAYSHDLLNEQSVASIRRTAKTYIADPLTLVSNQLRILGEHALADFYSPRHHSWFNKELDGHSKLLFDFIVREGRILNAWIPLLGLGRPEKAIERAREESRVALAQFPRREMDWSFLVPAIELEATAGIEAHIGRPVSRQLILSGSPERSPESQALLSTRLRNNVIEFPGMRPGAQAPSSRSRDEGVTDLDLAA